MHENLIILGAGATAAISDGKLPTADNFFSCNKEWSNCRGNYPHLSYIHTKHLSFKKKITLTDAWLFIDTLLKYHLATRCNNVYNANLLRRRYQTLGKNIPSYLSPEYLNDKYDELRSGFRPLFSTLEKQIYHTFPQIDIVNYFLTLAGWELKHLLYKTYHPSIEIKNLYEELIKALKGTSISVMDLNFDIYFERACMSNSQKLQLAKKDEKADNDTIYLCKPHGGWNIKHIDHYINPYCKLHEYVDDDSFDKKETGEIRPAMIPYFLSPDEITKEHGDSFPNVGGYFLDQQERMGTMFEAAKNIVSVGYSFSEMDLHVRELVKRIDKKGGKNLFCILKGDVPKKDIKNLWGFDSTAEGNKRFQYCGCGFDEKSIRKITEFLNGVQ